MTFETKYLIRWGIPGWVLIFWILYYYFALLHINPADITIKDGSKVVTVIIALTALGVPIGYLLHQIYFLSAWLFNMAARLNVDEIVNQIENFPYERDNEGNKIWGEWAHEDYFHMEYIWHTVLVKLGEDGGAYWEARYRYLLSTIHGLGSLWVSLFISLIVGYGIVFANSINVTNILDSYFFTFGLVVHGALFAASFINFVYYSRNLRALQAKVMKDYFKTQNKSI
ncbi:hypothetical protein ASG98_17750 [Bacillus sp. Soil531]|nr:hypothetical protein ASG98_17750 [Bacillus sp. Soil531]